jgi:hypothetical protein
MSTPQAGAAAPLTRDQADDVLRYWLAALRLEESLQVRPRARRVQHGTVVPRLDYPAAGQDYFKLPLDGPLATLLSAQEPLQRGFDGELCAFFEGWLLNQYRRSQDETELSHLLCFPVVHLPRGELAGLLRCGVRVRFGTRGEKIFRAPSRAERQRAAYPPVPDEVRIGSVPRGEGVWPFFIDTRLLAYPLGLQSEDIDALFEALRALEAPSERDMLRLVTEALEKAASPETARAVADDDVEALLPRLRRAMQTLLSRSQSRAEVYPVGIVIDGSQARTTWHLQRELVSLSEGDGADSWPLESCLGSYLTRRASPADEAAQRALFPGPSLTKHQRSAAESLWGSRLTAVQGPPGTGKTTLILHLCAEALLRQVDSLLDDKVMGQRLLVITSSNNRAVDNVMEPLCPEGALPLALRVGSRQVCEQSLTVRLRTTASWLAKAQLAPPAVRATRLSQELAEYARLRAQLEALLAPRKLALEHASERTRLTQALAALPVEGRARSGKTKPTPERAPLTQQVAESLDKKLEKVELRLRALSELCEAKPGMAQVNAVARHYERTAKKDLPALEDALTEAGLRIDIPLPPLQTPLDVGELMEVWEEGAELFLSRLTEVRERVDQVLRAKKQTRRADELRTKLHALGADMVIPESVSDDELSRALFLSAVRVREAWAEVHAAALAESIDVALRCVEQERSLRPLFRNEPEHATLLCRLFGVWGSTLLSLGNCLPAEPDTIAQVVIDEAGQCHPAHAVSALLRAESALVIGDVHQLAPVIELTVDDEARLLRSARLKTSPQQLLPYRVHQESQVSAQSLADQAVTTRHTLVDHFRCAPEIIAVSDALCGYGLHVHARPQTGEKRMAHAVSMLDLRGEQERSAGSLYNELELRETLLWVERLLARGVSPSELAVITPYRGQLERLRRGLMERKVPLEYSPELADAEGPTPRSAGGLALGTVHRFQGGERNIVLFSSVVTRTSSLAFLNARPNLLNVAVPRHHFVCLGDRETLRQGKLTRVLVDAAVLVEPR